MRRCTLPGPAIALKTLLAGVVILVLCDCALFAKQAWLIQFRMLDSTGAAN